MPPPTLETDRLLLRPFFEEDAEAFFRLNSDPDVLRYTGDPGVKTIEEARIGLLTRPIADYATYGFGRLACILKQNGQLIGFAGLKRLEDLNEVDVGYRLLPPYWGVGLATEAARAVVDQGFRHLGLDKIIGLVDPEHVRSIRVLAKLGMTFDRLLEYRSDLVARYAVEKDSFLRTSTSQMGQRVE